MLCVALCLSDLVAIYDFMFSNNFLALRALSISAGLITEAHEVSPAIIDVANKKL